MPWHPQQHCAGRQQWQQQQEQQEHLVYGQMGCNRTNDDLYSAGCCCSSPNRTPLEQKRAARQQQQQQRPAVAWQQQLRACCSPWQHVYDSGSRDLPAASQRAEMQGAQLSSAYPPSTAAAHACITGSRVSSAAACNCTGCGAASSAAAAAHHAVVGYQYRVAEVAASTGATGTRSCKLVMVKATEPRHVHDNAAQRLLAGHGSSVAAAAGAAAPRLAAGLVLHTSAPQMLPANQ
jgi:hypothetical protein